ncbi:preprotein translocase subunit Sss1 [Nocardiopsis mwathae]|uniref:Preprotein translocase subunit Sss1 n=1 Tax=Nocardiopsis mwathae TaxID=1472723 RepID=A0A7W9YIL9_9ACTN|nr:hypothetical protein [Nocardiopsis mwathae]MBB6172840.1 preprotein translocase subunit Sss1 [Nocardiopsis mwathae]
MDVERIVMAAAAAVVVFAVIGLVGYTIHRLTHAGDGAGRGATLRVTAVAIVGVIGAITGLVYGFPPVIEAFGVFLGQE